MSRSSFLVWFRRVKKPKVVVLVFSSGKLVVTGGKTVNDCEEGVQVIRKGLENMGLLSSSGSEQQIAGA